ncbi:MAG: hypothetical protein ACK56F_31595, partial [bacterium]
MAARKALAARPEHKTLLAAQKSPVVSRADSFRIARQSYRAPVVSRADSFRTAAGLLPSDSLVAPRSSCARRFDHKMIWPRERRWLLD